MDQGRKDHLVQVMVKGTASWMMAPHTNVESNASEKHKNAMDLVLRGGFHAAKRILEQMTMSIMKAMDKQNAIKVRAVTTESAMGSVCHLTNLAMVNVWMVGIHAMTGAMKTNTGATTCVQTDGSSVEGREITGV